MSLAELQMTGRCCVQLRMWLSQTSSQVVQELIDAANNLSRNLRVRLATLMPATSLKKESIAFSVSRGGGGAMPASRSLFASVALKLRAPLPCPPCAHRKPVDGLPAHSYASQATLAFSGSRKADLQRVGPYLDVAQEVVHGSSGPCRAALC